MIKRSQIAGCLAFLFLGFISAPVLVHVSDIQYDISVILDANEEEEQKGNESIKDIEFEISQLGFKSEAETSDRNWLSFHHYSNLYSSLYKEQISPPPEFS